MAEEVRKLEKKFKEGTRVRVRILGFRHLEGLATGILKVLLLKYCIRWQTDSHVISHVVYFLYKINLVCMIVTF